MSTIQRAYRCLFRLLVAVLMASYATTAVAADPIGYLVLDFQDGWSGGSQGDGTRSLKRYDADLNLVWETRDFFTGEPQADGPNDFNMRSLTDIIIGDDGYIYGGFQGTDSLGYRINLGTGVPEVRFLSADAALHNTAGLAFGPKFGGGAGNDSLFITTRSGIEVHDVIGQSNAAIENDGGQLDLGGGVTQILWEDLFGTTLPEPPSGTPGSNDRWGQGIARGPDANSDGRDDMYFAISVNPGGNDDQFVAVLSSVDLSVIKTIKSEWDRRMNSVAFDASGNMYTTNEGRDGTNVHVGAVDHEADVADPNYITEENARWIKASGTDNRADNPTSIYIADDGKVYVAGRFGYHNDGTPLETDGGGMALIYEEDAAAGLQAATPPTVVLQADDSGEPGYVEFASIRQFLPIFASAPVVLAGDYNDDGIVDARDYTVWRDTLGSTVDLRANGDNTGGSMNVIDEADYAVWKLHFGETLGSGALAATAVPEPASWLLFVCGAAACAARRRKILRKG